MSETYLCTDCPERCILTKEFHTCGKDGDRIWLHREKIICRSCKNVAETCYECTREPDKDRMAIPAEWETISTKLWEQYKARNPKKKFREEKWI